MALAGSEVLQAVTPTCIPTSPAYLLTACSLYLSTWGYVHLGWPRLCSCSSFCSECAHSPHPFLLKSHLSFKGRFNAPDLTEPAPNSVSTCSVPHQALLLSCVLRAFCSPLNHSCACLLSPSLPHGDLTGQGLHEQMVLPTPGANREFMVTECGVACWGQYLGARGPSHLPKSHH